MGRLACVSINVLIWAAIWTLYKPLTASQLFAPAKRRMQLQTDVRCANLATRIDAKLARLILGFHIFGVAIVSVCLAIAILA